MYKEWKGKMRGTAGIVPQPFKHGSKSFKKTLYHVPFILRLIALAALILAMARPRSSSDYEITTTEGIDIMLTIDVSSSMLADFKPDRIAAAKDIAIQFIAERPTDRMGIVVFAGNLIQCPLTTDQSYPY